MELPDELQALLRLADAGVVDPVDVGMEWRDGPGVGGTMSALALTQPVDEVVAALTELHGPPELIEQGPGWLQGPAWSRRHESEHDFQGVLVMVLDGADRRPPFAQVEQIPDDATGFVLVDRSYGLRNPPTTYEQVQRPPPPRRGLRGWLDRRRRR
ncbi:MAG: hypothetical protein AAFZ07_03915 [Actinomycetota bacterium]